MQSGFSTKEGGDRIAKIAEKEYSSIKISLLLYLSKRLFIWKNY